MSKAPIPVFCLFHSFQVSIQLLGFSFIITSLRGPFERSIGIDTSLLSVSDTEILQLDWCFNASNGEGPENYPSYSVKPIGAVNGSCCYQYAAISSNRQLLAVASSKDNILLYNIPQETQISDFGGHTG